MIIPADSDKPSTPCSSKTEIKFENKDCTEFFIISSEGAKEEAISEPKRKKNASALALIKSRELLKSLALCIAFCYIFYYCI